MAMLTVDADLDGAARLDITIEQMPPHVAVGLDAGDVGRAARTT